MIDLNKLVNNSMEKIEQDGTIQEMVEEHLKKAMTNVISNVCGSYSPLQKELEGFIKENLKVNLDAIKIEQYNQFVADKVNDMLKTNLIDKASDDLNKRLSEFLTEAKDEYKFSEIIEKLKEESDIESYEESRCMSLHIEEESYGYLIYMDVDEGKSEYECDCKFTISKKNNRIKYLTVKTYFGEKGITSNPLESKFGFEEFLYSLYLHGSEITFDGGTDADDYEDDLYVGGEDLD